MARNKLWLAALPAVVALSLGACTSGGTGDSGTSDQSGATNAADTGDVPSSVITANSTEPQNPLIPTNTNEVGGGRVVDLLFAGLVYYGEDGSVHNEVAESIETEDSQTYTVTLKSDQKFSDGTPVTANSFVDAWALGAKNGDLSAYFFAPIEGTDDAGMLPEGTDTMSGLEVIDDSSFTITLKQPESDFPLRLGYSAFYPLPQSTLDNVDEGGENPIGNGPYKLEEGGWVHNERMILVPNETYEGDRKAQNGGVEFIFYPDYGPAYADLQSGQLDVLDQIPDDALSTFQEELGSRAINQAAALTFTFTIPESLEHFEGEEGKLRRQAISMAINRPEVTEKIFANTYTPAKDFTSPVIDGFTEGLKGAEVLDFNADEAKKLWAEADAINKWDGEFKIAYNNDGGHQAWVDAIANQIKNNLEIDAEGAPYPDFKSLRDDVTNRTIATAFRTGWQADYPGLVNFLGPLYGTGAGSNDGDYSNAEFDRLLSEASAASSVEEGNALLQEAQEILLQDLPAIPLWYANATGGFAEGVENVAFGWNSVPLYYQITK